VSRKPAANTAAADRLTPDAAYLAATLRITEIFYSLQGETSRTGLPTVFIRLTGCPLRCGYCDTAYAFHGGNTLTVAAALEAAARYRTRYVTVTGGEPLAQKNCHALLSALCERDYSVSLETSGAIDVSAVDARVAKILDIKTPGSGELAKNLWGNLDHLTARDEIKFVICDETDYVWAKQQLAERDLAAICPVLFSPSYRDLDAAKLADWILRDQLAVRLQTQLHKQLWGEQPGR
jgi:7-carboxy-7-deazaguanine synthase